MSTLFKTIFIIVLSIGLHSFLLCDGTRAQPKERKLTDKEKEEAVVFAREFWAKLTQAKDIRPLLKQFGIKGFYKCLDKGDFAFLRKKQIRKERVPLIKRYYVAESNFMLLLMLSGISESDDQFSAFPPDVQKAITRSTWEAMENSDRDRDKPLSDRDANKYFDRVLKAFEKANPLLRKHIEKNWPALSEQAIKATKEYEENVSYEFEPMLGTFDKGLCGLRGKSREFIAIDVPFFQLMLTKIGGRFRVVQFPFHID
jgi:hypothetical protein